MIEVLLDSIEVQRHNGWVFDFKSISTFEYNKTLVGTKHFELYWMAEVWSHYCFVYRLDYVILQIIARCWDRS